MEENLRNVVGDVMSTNKENCSNQEKLENDTSSIVVNNICLSDGINLNESSKEIYKRYCDTDNGRNTVRHRKRFLNLMDSDSIEETSLYETLNKNSNAYNEYHSGSSDIDLQISEHNNSKNKSLRRIIDSESEEDIQTNESKNFPQMVHNTISATAENYQALIDSESEEEKQNEKSKEETQISGNNLPQTIHNIINTTIESYQTLIDSESEEEKQNEEIKNDILISSKKKTSESKDVKKKSIKKRKGSIRASKNEAMRQIHSESQRLLRETEISLPYHRPKQRTLQEFLNRKKISAALPKAPSTAAKLKMSSAIVSQVLAEKEKEAELFYKSSDSEDDMQQSMPLVSKDIKISSITNEREISLINIDGTCIQDPERIEISIRDFQDNKKEIVKKDHLDLNPPKYQVFLEKDFCEIDQAVELTDNNDNPDDGSDTSLQQITNEHNQNLRELGLPKKLFDSHFENGSSEINRDEQEAKRIIETIISLNKEKCINEKKSKITVIENQILKVHQDDSEVINRRNKNPVSNITTSILQRANLEATKILTLSSSINSKEVIEIFQSDNDVSHNVICSNSNDCTIIQDKNNEKKDKYSKINDITLPSLVNNTQSKIQDNPSTNECEKFDGHIQGLPLLKFADQALTNRKKLSALKSNSKVTLRGSPGTIIDLTDAKPNKKGVNTLLDRFFCKHVNTKKQSNNKSEITVIHLQNIENDLPIKEVLPYKVPVNIDDSELNKPGAKLMRLKEDLKLQMTLKRNKEWKQKEKKLQAQEEEEWNKEEKSDYDLDEEKTELDFELSDSEESEPEENDICIKDKKRSKCQFADDEAEVTDNEDSSIEETCNENYVDYVKHNKQSTRFKYRKEYMDDEVEIDEEEDNDDKDEVEENEESLDANVESGDESDFKDDDDIVCKSFSIANNKNDRKTRQFREEFQNDSNINPSYLRNDNSQLNMVTDIDASETHCKDNDWINENASNIPACQQHVEVTTRSQICKTPLMKTSMLDLISPITQLSVLNTTLDSNKKDSSEKRECVVEYLSMENTQNDESSEHVCSIRGSKSILRKKLFDDIGETIDDKYLMRLCSGKFESTQRTDLDLSSQSNVNELQLGPSESELCPGNSNVKLVDVKQLKISEVNDEMLEDIKLTLDNSNNSVNHTKEINKVNAIDSEIKYRIVSSDDEDEDTFLRPKKRSAKKLNLSDSEGENSQFFDEENDGVDNEETEEQYVDYDSEENEMIVVPGKDIKKIAGGFLEEEAELSESDWDSSDEDEKDLDKLEVEEADDEHIDEHEVKDQLEKIHMKQILDEDKREVRLLKELLFEDGDLHTDGMGRERKFKWRNIDKLGNNIEISQMSNENDGWVDVQEDEEEAKWSKLRYERDKFLEERMKCLNNEIEDELCDSQIFKLGLEAVRKIKDNGLQRQDTSLNKIDPSENMEPIMPRNITDLLNGSNIGKKCQTIYNVIKKRSLLTRGEESLARIASLAKQGDSASNAANTRNFVFPHIDQSTNNTLKKEQSVADLDSQIKPGKRKMMSNISSTLKKRRK